MRRECQRDASGIANSVLDAIHQRHVDAIARRHVAARLGNADNRPRALQLLACDSEVAKAFDVDRSFARVLRVVKPDFAAAALFVFFSHH